MNSIGGPLTRAGFYLAGGTGLALQMGHRKSADLDFFVENGELNLPSPARLKGVLGKAGRFRVVAEEQGTLHSEVSGIRVSLLAYRSSLIRKPVRAGSILLAHSIDIGLMKLSAIVSRGSKKDFVDMACILRNHISLAPLLRLAPQKYPESPDFAVTVFKALGYFKDAEREDDPILLDESYRWSKVKGYIEDETKKAFKLMLKGKNRGS